MKHIRSRRIGRFTLDILDTGSLWLDGGAMFGVVPRTLWEQKEAPDNSNRILLNCNSLLISDGHTRVLVETGVGQNWEKKHLKIYNIRQASIEEGLKEQGLIPEQIDHVINTHLHFDHAGGNVIHRYNQLVPAFPKAMYHIQVKEYQHAARPFPKDRASYRRDDIAPLAQHGRLSVHDGETEIIPGITLLPVGGHSPGMQLVEIVDDKKRALFMGDLVPMRHHVSIPWLMAYDCYPVEVSFRKEEILEEALTTNTLLVLYHDNRHAFGRLERAASGTITFQPEE